ncbi:MAG: hypothetical protein ACJAUO_000420 [Sediminicola sp.]|jgi:hypothetical protein
MDVLALINWNKEIQPIVMAKTNKILSSQRRPKKSNSPTGSNKSNTYIKPPKMTKMRAGGNFNFIAKNLLGFKFSNFERAFINAIEDTSTYYK